MSAEIGGLRAAHGLLVDVDFDRQHLKGWIALPDVNLDRVAVYVDNSLVAGAELMPEPAIARKLDRYVPPNELVSFSVDLADGTLRTDQVHQIVVVGKRAEIPVARLKTLVFTSAIVPQIPVPPPQLIELTQGDHDAQAYRMLGFRFYQQFRGIIGRHRAWNTIRRMFDWGCGSGRIAAFFLSEANGPEVHGGDINHDAAAWCQAYLNPGQFRALHPLPPLPYANRCFDLIVSIAVVSGCGAAEYGVWLPELRRLLSPGGLLLMSVPGRFSAEVLYPTHALEMLERDGLLDGTAFDEAHPPPPEDQRYRGAVYLSRKFIKKVWSPHFEILEHLEGELNSDLDLLLVRRRD